MLFAKLLLSPMPHARVTRIDTSAALAMPGVKAILTADDLPAVVDGREPRRRHHREHAQRARPDEGAAVPGRADSRRRRRRRADRGRSDREDSDRVRAAALRRRSAREPAARRSERADAGQRLGAPAARRRRRRPAGPGGAAAAPRPRGPKIQELKWTDEDFAAAQDGQLPLGQAHRRVVVRRRRGGLQEGRPRARRDVRRRTNTSHQPLETRTAMAYWQNGKLYLHGSHAEHGADRRARSRAGSASTPTNVVLISEYTGGGFGSKISGVDLRWRSRRCCRRRPTRR